MKQSTTKTKRQLFEYNRQYGQTLINIHFNKLFPKLDKETNKKLNKDTLITTNQFFNAYVRKLKLNYNISNTLKCERTWLQHVNKLQKTLIN